MAHCGRHCSCKRSVVMCNQKNIPEMTAEQVVECQGCKYASGRKVWCCLFGIPIIEKGRIFVPDRKIAYPSRLTMGANFAKESVRYLTAGRPNRTEKEQALCRAICERPCDYYVAGSKLGPRCSKCGCCINLKTRWATAHCPLGKW